MNDDTYNELKMLNLEDETTSKKVQDITRWFYNFEPETTKREVELLCREIKQIGRETFIAYGKKLKQVTRDHNPEVTFDKILTFNQYFASSTRKSDMSVLKPHEMDAFNRYLDQILDYAYDWGIFYNTPEEATLLPKLITYLTKLYDYENFFNFSTFLATPSKVSPYTKPRYLGTISSRQDYQHLPIKTSIIIFCDLTEVTEIEFSVACIKQFSDNLTYSAKPNGLFRFRLLETKNVRLLINDTKTIMPEENSTASQDAITVKDVSEFYLENVKLQLTPQPTTDYTHAQISLTCALTKSGIFSRYTPYGWVRHDINIAVYNLAAKK